MGDSTENRRVEIKPKMAYAQSPDVRAIRMAYHRGEINDDRVRCFDCRHFRTEKRMMLKPGDQPWEPPVNLRGIREICQKGVARDSALPQRCPLFEWRA